MDSGRGKPYIDDVTHEGNPVLKIEVGGYSYGFTVRSVPEEDREWLLAVVARQLQEVHDTAVRDTRLEIQKGIKTLLGIKI
jgi:hypothetical protein